MNEQLAKKIFDEPHRLGLYLGYKDLTPIHGEWIKYIWHTKQSRTLQAHRGSYKTTALVVIGTIWYLLYNPDDTVLICREEFTGAADTLAEIRKHYQSATMATLYNELYGNQRTLSNFRADSLTLATKQSVTKEGSIECIGLGGASTGRHYTRIITDDIVTSNDRYSKAKREQTKRFFQELQNIVNPDGAISNSCTTWHPEDATSIMPNIKKYPILSVDIKGFNAEKIEQLKATMSPALYSANYELRHIAEADRILANMMRTDWQPVETIAYLDPAYHGDNTTAMSIGYMRGNDIIARGFVWRKSITELYSNIKAVCAAWRVSKLYCESNADKGMSAIELRKFIPRVIDVNEREPKAERIENYVKGNFTRIYFAKDVDAEYAQQVEDYAIDIEPDDAADSLAGLVRELTKKREVSYIG